MFKIILNNCCGLDVHKTRIYACIGITDTHSRTEYYEANFSSFPKDLRKLSEWLHKYNCVDVCMESSGKYWIPVFNVLEETCKVTLAHTQNTRHFPSSQNVLPDHALSSDSSLKRGPQ